MDPDPLSFIVSILAFPFTNIILFVLAAVVLLHLVLLASLERYIRSISKPELELLEKEFPRVFAKIKHFYSLANSPSLCFLVLKLVLMCSAAYALILGLQFIKLPLLIGLLIFISLALSVVVIPLVFNNKVSRWALTGIAVFNPLLLVLAKLTNIISKPKERDSNELSLQDVREALMEGEKIPNLSLYRQIIRFDKIRIRQVMRPKSELRGIKSNYNFKEVLQKIDATHFSRLPVYEGSWNKPLGIIHCKDLLPYTNRSTLDWKKMIRPLLYVNENDFAQEVLRRFQHTKNHMALVLNKNKRIVGLVTLEDITEEIIGEIDDE